MKSLVSTRNRIIESLPAAERLDLFSDLAVTELKRGQVLYRPDEAIELIYFPERAVISFLGNTGDGGTVELWSVGHEGVAGMSGILATGSPFRAVVQVEGRALSIKRAALLRHFKRSDAFHDCILRYYHCLLMQASQLGVCNNAHPVEQRFSRWLLMLQDRSGASRLHMTQESIAGALGTRRATISVAAAALQDAKVISYTPGSIQINSRRRLQATTCHCYKFIKSHFDAA